MNDERSSSQNSNLQGIRLDLENVEAATEAGHEVTVFRYRRPAQIQKKRGIAPLARSDILFSAIQVIREGGENSLHSHTAMDGFWFVLSGRARFYGAANRLIAELGRHEGMLIPRNVQYWFESVGDELLELLQVEAIDKRVKNKLVRHAPRKTLKLEVFKPEGELLGVLGEAGNASSIPSTGK